MPQRCSTVPSAFSSSSMTQSIWVSSSRLPSTTSPGSGRTGPCPPKPPSPVVVPPVPPESGWPPPVPPDADPPVVGPPPTAEPASPPRPPAPGPGSTSPAQAAPSDQPVATKRNPLPTTLRIAVLQPLLVVAPHILRERAEQAFLRW